MSGGTMADNLLVGSKATQRAFLQADASDAERAIVMWAKGSARTPYSDVLAEMVMSNEACDQSELNTGRAPLLVDHDHSVDGVVGKVECAWLEGRCGWAIVRFGKGPRARAVARDVRDGILCNASVGFSIRAAELYTAPDGERWQRITSWAPYEISIVALGEDRAAHLRVGDNEGLSRLLADRQAFQKTAALLRRRNALRADLWERWAPIAAEDVARRFQLDRHAVGEAMAALVREQLAALTEIQDA